MDGHQKQREQSGRMIEEALFALMREKEFAKITISEIAARADVARRTFYRLYAGKEEVLRGYIKRLAREYQRTFPALAKYDPQQIAKDFFDFWYLHRDFLLLLYHSGLEELFYCEIRGIAGEVVRNRMGVEQNGKDMDVVCFALYSVGGFLMLLHQWAADGMRELPDAYAKRTGAAILKYIRSAAAFE